ncbi:hypothetical protein GCM10028816_34930 [Spirosoma lituiforme]
MCITKFYIRLPAQAHPALEAKGRQMPKGEPVEAKEALVVAD